MNSGGTGGGSAGGDAGASCTDAPPELVDSLLLNTAPAMNGKPSVRAYRVRYRSTGNLEIYGQICVPQSAGPHPIVVYNHGGFAGVSVAEWGAGQSPENQCYSIASNGAIAVMSQYRGETDRGISAAGPIDLTSGGRIEVCLGEVDDVQALIELARKRCDAAADHVVVFGFSHGGCITLQLAGRAPPWLRAAIPFVAPVDLAAEHAYLKAMAQDAGPNPVAGCGTAEFTEVLRIAETAIGTPTSNPQGYRDRSPVFKAAQIARVPLYMTHGLSDCIVPYRQGCAMRQALQDAGAPLASVHLTVTGQPVTTPVPDCGPDDWSTAFISSDGGFDTTHLAIAVDGMNHGMTIGGTVPITGSAIFAAQYGL